MPAKMKMVPATPQDDLRNIFGPEMATRLKQATNTVLDWAGKRMIARSREKYMLDGFPFLESHNTFLTKRSGDLAKSLRHRVARRENSLTLSAGGRGRAGEYAAAHEQEGKRGTFITITPKTKRWLKIPMDDRALTPQGRPSNRQELQNLIWINDKSQPGKRAFLMDKKGRFLFVMKKKVQLKARPYLLPAIEDVLPLLENRHHQDTMRILGGG